MKYAIKKLLVVLALVLYVIVLSLLTSCKATKQNSVSDSTYVKETQRIIQVLIPPDSTKINFRINCDPITNKPVPVQAFNKSNRASQKITIDTLGNIQAQCLCDEEKARIAAKDREIFRLRKENNTEFVQRPLSWLDWFCRCVTLFSGLYFLYKLKKAFI